MSSNLNLLPNKSWHVWKRENRSRVERDEAENLDRIKKEKIIRNKQQVEDLYNVVKSKIDGKNRDHIALFNDFDDIQLKTKTKQRIDEKEKDDVRSKKGGIPLQSFLHARKFKKGKHSKLTKFEKIVMREKDEDFEKGSNEHFPNYQNKKKKQTQKRKREEKEKKEKKRKISKRKKTIQELRREKREREKREQIKKKRKSLDELST